MDKKYSNKRRNTSISSTVIQKTSKKSTFFKNLIINLYNRNEEITCIEMICITSMGDVIKKINCLIVGYSSGSISIYSIPNRKQILNQKIHDKPIIQIKARTVSSIPLMGTEEESDEELSILFEDSTLVIIEGDSLVTLIRSEFMKLNEMKISKDPGSLLFRKYQLKHTTSGKILDFISTGSNGIRENTFGTMIIAVGKNPMISVYLSCKDSGSLITIASNVASKLTSSIVSFAKSWWGNSENQKKQSETIEPPLPKSTKTSRIAQLEDPR